MRYEHRRLTDWPGGSLRFNRSPDHFRASWGTTIEDLERELHYLRAKDVVLETAHPDRDIRLDGTIKPSAGRPAHPGVVLSFESKYGPLRYWTDVYAEWRANVRAIALGLAALRAVDRYGITSRGEQYTGWAKLPPGKNGHGVAPAMTEATARQFIATTAGLDKGALVDAAPEIVAYTYRLAARRAHPDVRGGLRDQWDQLERARDLLGVAK